MTDYLNMPLYGILIAIFIANAGSILLASLFLLLKKETLSGISHYMVSFAGGSLLGVAFLGMMTKAGSLLETDLVFRTVLAGIVAFFLLEKIILWHVCHDNNCTRHKNASAPLILIGDAFHNFIDGIAIAAAFLTSESVGIMVTISVLAHEIPQELADFAILVENGYSRKKALFFNLLSGSTALIGGLIAFLALETANQLIPWVLSVSAASFIYIALADLVPEMHQKTNFKNTLSQIVLLLAGILLSYLITL